MKRKGFTLIELLAVIVVLAIIALIATPIVMNTIKNAKKGAAERTADNYTKAIETALTTERLDNIKIMDGAYIINEDGSFDGFYKKTVCEKLSDGRESCNEKNLKKKINLEMNGTQPTSGSIVITNGEIDLEHSFMKSDNYSIGYKDGKMVAIDTKKALSNKLCVNVSGKSGQIGTRYVCEFGDGIEYSFFILEDGDTTTLTTGRQAQAGQVSLIMDRNLGEKVAWDSNDSSTPETAKNYLKEQTTGWTKLTAASGTASLPSAYQIAQAGNVLDKLQTFILSNYSDFTVMSSELPGWLSGNLSYDTSNTTAIAYWLLEKMTKAPSYPFLVKYGNLTITGGMPYYTPAYGGIRPVITISKSQLG